MDPLHRFHQLLHLMTDTASLITLKTDKPKTPPNHRIRTLHRFTYMDRRRVEITKKERKKAFFHSR